MSSLNNNPPASTPVAMVVVGGPPSLSGSAAHAGTPVSTFTTDSSNNRLDLTDITWADVIEDDSGNAIGVRGHKWDYFSVRELNTLSSNFKVKGTRNVKKGALIEKITTSYHLRRAYGAINLRIDRNEPQEDDDDSEKAPRKQVQCPFRLMNILFSDEFAADFGDLGKIATRQVLDSGKAGNQQHFWERVASAFTEDNEEYGQLRYLDDPILADNSHIKPAKIQRHGWAKLKAIWKVVKADYNTAVQKYQQSGTHDHNFFAFCNNKVETYYLRKCLELRPNLTASIEAHLPEECALSSEGTATTSAVASASNKKQKKEGSELSSVLREFQSGVMSSDLTKKKILILGEDHEENKRRQKTDDWLKLEEKLLSLRRDLRKGTIEGSLDEESKADLTAYIGKIAKLKNQLEVELGI